MATDPVCGMFVDERTATLRLVRDNRTYYFCGPGCLESFANPEERLRELRIRLGVAWPAATLTLLLTYLFHFPGWTYVAFGLASVVQFYAGASFYRGCWEALRARVANMDILIATGTTVAYLYSTWVLFLPGQLPLVLFFDASAFIITLILTGNYLELLTRDRARRTLRELHALLPVNATVLREGRESEISVAEVQPGDRIVVKPGGRIPADGTIEAGRSAIDEAILTGESLPRDRGPGDPVVAGALNGQGRLVVLAQKVGEDSFLGQVSSLLLEAETSQVPLQRTADRLASVFTPVVLALALLSALLWAGWGHAPVDVALLIFVTVAITACPCAFGLATPAAIVVGTGRAAREGILFKGRDAIQRASTIDLILADKTGTLTKGTPELTDLVPVSGSSADELLTFAVALESASSHPLARAVVKSARERSLRVIPALDLREIPGTRIEGNVEGQLVAILPDRAVAESAMDTAGLRGEVARLGSEGKTWSLVTVGGRPLGVLGFADPIAPGIPGAIAALRAEGIPVVVLSGDNEASVKTAAARAGVSEYRAGLSPGQKLAYLRSRQAEGKRVAFVGDGVNDAPALAAADLGIAIGAGTEVAKEAGQVILVKSDFADVGRALRIARRTRSRVERNLAWAVGYNAVLLPIAAGALVPVTGFGIYAFLPMLGALAMGLSSTSVMLNSLSLAWVDIDG